ncbi:CD63 antigen isoform X2 [Lissotriton helveticus]
MAVSGGMKCVKYLVFIFNFLFWIAGIALIGLGIYVQVALNKTIVIQNASSSGAPIVLIIVGAVIFVVSFFGCCGAWKENYCMVTTFAVILTLIFLVEVAAAIAGYIFKDKFKAVIDEGFRKSMADYSSNNDTRLALDTIQQDFKCCGANATTDWKNYKPFENGSLPDSCCVTEKPHCGTEPTSAKFTDGCVAGIKAWLEKNLKVIAGVAIGIAAFELLGIIFACCLMKGIRSGYEVM